MKLLFSFLTTFLLVTTNLNGITGDNEKSKLKEPSLFKSTYQVKEKNDVNSSDARDWAAINRVKFLTIDLVQQTPAKFVGLLSASNSSTLNAQDAWNEQTLFGNLASNFVYANMSELRSGSTAPIESKTNLNRFLLQNDQYVEPTSLEYQMPYFIKSTLDVPSILDCPVFTFQDLTTKMENHLNYDDNELLVGFGGNGNEIEIKKREKLVCLVKGTLSFTASLATKTFAKEFLNAGDCFYLPISDDDEWKFKLKTESAWLFVVSWRPFTQSQLTAGDSSITSICSSREDHKTQKISEMDSYTEPKKFENLIYLTSYLNFETSPSVNKTRLYELLKEDKNLMVPQGVEFDCSNFSCERLLTKLFDHLDVNSDGLFSDADLSTLDEDSALLLNGKIKNAVSDLVQQVQRESYAQGVNSRQQNNQNQNSGRAGSGGKNEQMEKLKDAVVQLKQQSKGNEKVLVKQLKDNMKQWYSSLSEHDQKRLEDVNIEQVIEDLFLQPATQQPTQKPTPEQQKGNANDQEEAIEVDAEDATEKVKTEL